MTDQRLRDLERDAASGDLQTQARLLLERVRVGQLTEERLRLAAYLGDEAARVALDADPAAVPAAIEDLLGVIRVHHVSLLPEAMTCVARTALDDNRNILPATREECERVLSATQAGLHGEQPERLWEAARLADQVYNAASRQQDFAVRSLATAPAFLADKRISAESMCSFVSSATTFLGVSTERVRDALVVRLLSPCGSST